MEARLDVFEAWVEDPSLVTDLGLIDQHKKRTINCWRTAPYSERDAAFLMRCMHQAQYDIVLMMDSVYLRSAEVLDKVLKRVLAALLSCLEGLLEFIERHRPLYFNMGQKVPDCIRVRKGLEQAAGKDHAEALLPEGCTYAQLNRALNTEMVLSNEPVEQVCPDCLSWLLESYPEGQSVEEIRERRRYESVWSRFKLHMPMSVKEIGLFLGVLIAAGIFKLRRGDKRSIFMFLAHHIRTDQTENLSHWNLYNQSTSKDQSVLNEVKKRCMKMLEIVEVLKE